MRNLSATLLLLCLAGQAVIAADPGTDLRADDAQRHSEAIAMARSGEWPAALREIAELRQLYPANESLLVDEIVVLAWSGQDAEAARRANSLDPARVPEYALATIAKANRNVRDFDQAARWYQEQIDRNPDDVDAHSGLVMTFADAGALQESRRALAAIGAGREDSPQLLLAQAYILELEARYLDALGVYDDVLALQPDNRAALRGKALALRALLLPRQALSVAYDHPGTLSAEEIAQLEADILALNLRYASRATYPEDRRYDGIDRALEDLNRKLDNPDLEPTVRRRLTYDKIVSLGDRLHEEEAIREFESLESPMEELPEYLLASVGTSYLQDRQPERAQELLEEAVRRNPRNLEYRFRLFFVYADLGAHDRALEIAEFLLANIEPLNREPGSPVVKGSEDYLRAAILKGLAVAYADRLDESQDHFERLLADIPNNQDIRSELATIYRWRGWVDRSMHEYAQILTVDPDFTPAQVGFAHAKIDGQYFDSVDAEIEALSRTHPEQSAIQNLDARWRLHQKSELRIDASMGENSGNTFGQDQYAVDAIWLSRPFSHKFRALLRAHDSYAEFPEGEANRRRAGAGIDYRHQRWSAQASLTADTGGSDLGLRTSLGYRLNDVVRLGARFETESNATPLRGARVGVSSTLLGGDVVWAWHESSRISAGLDWIDLSDGNQTLASRVAGEHRLINLLSYDLTALASIDMSTSKDDNVNYFSPLRSILWKVGLRNDHEIYRRYDFLLSHALIGHVGQHHQKNWGSGSVWDIEYRFRTQLTERFLVYAGISRASNVYDGNREYRTALIAGFGGRF